MAVREFSHASGEYINLGGGNIGAIRNGAFTLGGWVKPTSIVTNRVFFALHNGPAANNPTSTLAALASDGSGALALYEDVVACPANVGLTSGDWQFVAVTKASGTVAPRLHRWKLGDLGGMTHVTSGVSIANNALVCNNVQIGTLRNNGFASAADMRAAFFFVVTGTALSDANLEAVANTIASAGISAFSPSAAWELNQPSVANNVPDFTGEPTGAQFQRVGTTVVTTDDPPGYAFGPLAAPNVTVVPAVTGTPETGSTLTCSTGTWSGSPNPTFAYQWTRNGSNIGGATASTYVLQVADEGQEIRCRVTATNSQGSNTADSNIILAAAPPPVDIELRVSATGFGGSRGAQAGPDIFDSVTRAEADPGEAEYRLVYVYNNDSVPATVKVWVSAQPSPDTLAVGVATEAVDATVAAVANENTAPASVSFSSPASSGAAVTVANLNGGQHKGLWLRRTVPAARVGQVRSAAQLTLEVTPL
jgi:hypothetical protein